MAWECRTVPKTFDHSNTVTRDFDWQYNGEQFGWQIQIPRAYYHLHNRRHRFYTYGGYVAEKYTQRVISPLCKSLRRKASERDFSRYELARFAAAFVQHLPYTPDDISTPYSNYPRYPTETLVDETGDCEDSSLLLASILHNLNYSVVIIELPTHLAVGVRLPDVSGTVQANGREYAYIETTGSGWDIGTVPPKYRGQQVDIHTIADAHAVFTGWRAEASDGHLGVAGTVLNVGAGPARDVRFRLTVKRPDGGIVGQISQQWTEINTGKEHQWRDTIRIGDETKVTPQWILTVENRVHDKGPNEYQNGQ